MSSTAPYPQELNPWISNVSEHTSPLAETKQLYRPIHPSKRMRQNPNKQFEGSEDYDYVVDRKTGWKWYKEQQGNLPHASSSSSSSWQNSSWQNWKPWWWHSSKRSTDNSMGCVHRIHTRSVHHEQYSLLTSTNMKCVLVAQELSGSGLQRHHCAHEKSVLSGQPCHLRAGLYLTFSLPVYHDTKHHLDSTTFPKTTLYTVLLFQNLFSRQAALMNRSHSESGGNPRNTSPAGCEPKELATIFGSSLEDIYQLYDVQREFGEQDQQAPIIEEVKESGAF